MSFRTYPLEAGERDRIIQIEALTESVGSGGFPVETWVLLVTMFAKRAEVRGRETHGADGVAARVTTRFEVNYRSDLDPESIDVPKVRRIKAAGRTFDIVEASQIGRREGIEFLAIASTEVA